MVYRFKIVSEESPSLRIEIQIGSDANFLQLRNAILDAAGYDRHHQDIFFLCEDDWTPHEQIAMEDIDSDSETDIWIMADTPIEELVEEEGQKLQFVFDSIKSRSFLMEMKEMLFGKDLSAPVCTLRQGKAPAQIFKEKVKPQPPIDVTPKVLDELGLDFYGSAEYDADELPEGMEEEEE